MPWTKNSKLLSQQSAKTEQIQVFEAIAGFKLLYNSICSRIESFVFLVWHFELRHTLQRDSEHLWHILQSLHGFFRETFF